MNDERLAADQTPAPEPSAPPDATAVPESAPPTRRADPDPILLLDDDPLDRPDCC